MYVCNILPAWLNMRLQLILAEQSNKVSCGSLCIFRLNTPTSACAVLTLKTLTVTLLVTVIGVLSPAQVLAYPMQWRPVEVEKEKHPMTDESTLFSNSEFRPASTYLTTTRNTTHAQSGQITTPLFTHQHAWRPATSTWIAQEKTTNNPFHTNNLESNKQKKQTFSQNRWRPVDEVNDIGLIAALPNTTPMDANRWRPINRSSHELPSNKTIANTSADDAYQARYTTHQIYQPTQQPSWPYTTYMPFPWVTMPRADYLAGYPTQPNVPSYLQSPLNHFAQPYFPMANNLGLHWQNEHFAQPYLGLESLRNPGFSSQRPTLANSPIERFCLDSNNIEKCMQSQLGNELPIL